MESTLQKSALVAAKITPSYFFWRYLQVTEASWQLGAMVPPTD